MADQKQPGRRASRTVAPAKVPMTVYLPQDIAQWVTDEAGRRGVDRSRLIAAMILAYQTAPDSQVRGVPERHVLDNRLEFALVLLATS